jgi:type VI protein secretion system component Hcp
MNRSVGCWVVVAALLGGCGGSEVGMGGQAGTEAHVNPLEASGMVELYVKTVGADGNPFPGETTNDAFLGSVPAVQFYSDVTKASPGASTVCSSFQFTKAAGVASPRFAQAVSSGETLMSVHMDFTRTDSNADWQMIDLTSVRVSKLEQASTSPVPSVPSNLLEEVTLEPVGTAHVTLTSIPLLPDGSQGTPIPVTFTCKN